MKFLPIMLCALLLVGCKSVFDSNSMPLGATNLKDEGNGWYSFEWKGQCFLAKENSGYGSNNYDYAVTKVDCE